MVNNNTNVEFTTIEINYDIDEEPTTSKVNNYIDEKINIWESDGLG